MPQSTTHPSADATLLRAAGFTFGLSAGLFLAAWVLDHRVRQPIGARAR